MERSKKMIEKKSRFKLRKEKEKNDKFDRDSKELNKTLKKIRSNDNQQRITKEEKFIL